MHALGRLIQECKDADPTLTNSRISALSGGEVTPAMVRRWARADQIKLTDVPTTKSVLGLAKALQRPPVEIVLAAAEATGIDIRRSETSTFARRLPPGIDDLPPQITENLHRHLWDLYHWLITTDIPDEQPDSDSASRRWT